MTDSSSDDKTLPVARKKILLLTNADRGEIGVFLATSQALLEASSDIEVHFATFPGVEDLITTVSDEARKTNPTAAPVVYHEIKGPSCKEGIEAWLARSGVPHKEKYLPLSFLETPSFRVTRQAIRDCCPIMVPYDGPQLVQVVTSIIDIIKDVGPEILVVNSIMTPGLTVGVHSKIPMFCLSPNSIKDFAAATRSRLDVLWKFPALFSGHPYPVPLLKRFLNAYYVIHAAKCYLGDTSRKEAVRYLMERTGIALSTPVELVRDMIKGVPILVGTLPELDYPLQVPRHVHPCGPIVGRWRSVQEADRELAGWLARGPTLYINLGSILRMEEDQALEMAAAIKAVLEQARRQQRNNDGKGMDKLQVLWKLLKYGDYDTTTPKSAMYSILGPEIEAGVVRIDRWFVAAPITILQSGNIVCSVHHGGANSYNEAVISGLPQIVLPGWTDCYDYAQRVELHGLGRWGSRTTKPRWNAKELSSEIAYCIFGESAKSVRQKAKDMATIVESRGNGAVKAAGMIMNGLKKIEKGQSLQE